jgi:hypothetical protein
MRMAATEDRKRWAEPGDWERVKPTIERLYVKEGKKLREVMVEMETKYHFSAT